MDSRVADLELLSDQLAHERSSPDSRVVARLLGASGNDPRQLNEIVVGQSRGPARRRLRTERIDPSTRSPEMRQPPLHRRQGRMRHLTALAETTRLRKCEDCTEPPCTESLPLGLVLCDQGLALIALLAGQSDFQPLHGDPPTTMMRTHARLSSRYITIYVSDYNDPTWGPAGFPHFHLAVHRCRVAVAYASIVLVDIERLMMIVVE